jgi:hypothetical protein
MKHKNSTVNFKKNISADKIIKTKNITAKGRRFKIMLTCLNCIMTFKINRIIFLYTSRYPELRWEN